LVLLGASEGFIVKGGGEGRDRGCFNGCGGEENGLGGRWVRVRG